jgi:hypothetical protein
MVKLSLCSITEALCHEDVGEWRYSSIYLDLNTSRNILSILVNLRVCSVACTQPPDLTVTTRSCRQHLSVSFLKIVVTCSLREAVEVYFPASLCDIIKPDIFSVFLCLQREAEN